VSLSLWEVWSSKSGEIFQEVYSSLTGSQIHNNTQAKYEIKFARGYKRYRVTLEVFSNGRKELSRQTWTSLKLGGDGFTATVSGRPPSRTKTEMDGSWSSWENWTRCSKTCGGGFHFRTRKCDDPMPSRGGTQCQGPDIISKPCNNFTCEVDGMWSSWETWSTCSKPCGGGFHFRTRKCDDPPPSYGGIQCQGEDIITEPCNNFTCVRWNN